MILLLLLLLPLCGHLFSFLFSPSLLDIFTSYAIIKGMKEKDKEEEEEEASGLKSRILLLLLLLPLYDDECCL